MKFWLIVVVVLLIAVTDVKSDEEPQQILHPVLAIRDYHMPGVGGLCAGDTLIISCIHPDINHRFLINNDSTHLIIINDDNGTYTAETAPSSNAKSDALGSVWRLPSDVNQAGKTYRYKCLYGKLPLVNGQLQLQTCSANSYSADSNGCYLDDANERRYVYWRCTIDDHLQQILNQFQPTELHCNGMTTHSKTLWFFEGQLHGIRDREDDEIVIEQSKLSDAGVYTCLTYNKTTGHASKQYIDVDVIPQIRAPIDLFGVQEGGDLVVSWETVNGYADFGGRLRPRTVNLSHTVWYNAVYPPGFLGTDDADALDQNRIDTSAVNVTLQILRDAELYLVTVQSFYSNGDSSPNVTKLLFVNNASDTVYEVRKFGDMLDIKCGTDKFSIRYETKPVIKRHCTNRRGLVTRGTMTEAELRLPFLPEDACIYECSGVVYPYKYGKPKYTDPADFRFVINIRLKHPDPRLNSIRDLRCTVPTNTSLTITWSVDQSVSSESMTAVLILVGPSGRETFSTSLNARSCRFEQLRQGTMYDVWIVVQDENGNQGAPVHRRCSTTRYA